MRLAFAVRLNNEKNTNIIMDSLYSVKRVLRLTRNTNIRVNVRQYYLK